MLGNLSQRANVLSRHHTFRRANTCRVLLTYHPQDRRIPAEILKLMTGIEPATQALRRPCSTIELHQHRKRAALFHDFPWNNCKKPRQTTLPFNPWLATFYQKNPHAQQLLSNARTRLSLYCSRSAYRFSHGKSLETFVDPQISNRAEAFHVAQRRFPNLFYIYYSTFSRKSQQELAL